MKWLRGGALVACLWVAGCASQSARAPLPVLSPAELASAEAAQRERVVALADQPRWTLSGRVAVSRGREGGSGRLDWSQDGDRFELALSAPVTRQGWRLRGDPSGATLEGFEGGPRQGVDAAALLLEATRLDVPVAALAAWVRGVAADEAGFGRAEVSFGNDGRPARLLQAGWTIDYLDWAPHAGLVLPGRVTAERGEARVRLVIDAWDGGAPP